MEHIIILETLAIPILEINLGGIIDLATPIPEIDLDDIGDIDDIIDLVTPIPDHLQHQSEEDP